MQIGTLTAKVLILIILLIPIIGIAQLENRTNWQFSYYGDLIFHPGLKVGYETPLKNWVKTKTKKNTEFDKYKSLNVGLDFIYYWHSGHHHGLIFSPNVSYQRTKSNGKYFHLKFNLGYHKSFVDGKTYVVKDNDVSEKNFAGQNTIFNALSFGFGKDLRLNKNIPIRYFWEFGINGRAPYNKFYMPGIQLGFGIHYFLKA